MSIKGKKVLHSERIKAIEMLNKLQGQVMTLERKIEGARKLLPKNYWGIQDRVFFNELKAELDDK